ncbi:MAG: activator of HSP90 ATPase 1 family protein [Saprospiraceae bacterium]|nr:activator of HSP90 ATPase 1 family protein [Candidatus Vicinibacter affinis]MBP6173054.1 activator of HSP90 ATPase 1 family protein [Saprospiraceae bacterium]MBK7694999.1 activator of HSP90 ATPase 1 family protein [Candidatus Vicinibacter affinis]MBK7799850.1 activator of HSP90 ATPase 1 family protein [Candidatus Vicinibacter affinis]MBK8641699.1 activator of HSP90 ATPase 1 family protein [Candidatus Vicinibacter affinis]
MARVQFQTEFMFKASPSIIYLFVTQPTTIIRWFCDKVDNVGDHYTFSWDGDSEEATLVIDIEDEMVKYQWVDREEEFLQFRIYKTDITNETILEITDFCDDDEVQEQKDIWEVYIKKFKTFCGG